MALVSQVRDWIVPTNRRYPLDQLLGALREAFPYDKRKVRTRRYGAGRGGGRAAVGDELVVAW